MFAPLLDLILPRHCLICDSRSTTLLCYGCQHEYFDCAGTRCTVCAIDLVAGSLANLCGACLKEPPYFDRTVVAANYLPPIDHLVLQLKFGSRLELAQLMAQTIRDQLLQMPEVELPDLIIPLPLGSRRLQERGFNQSMEIARHLAQQIGVDIEPNLLRRIKETLAQSELDIKRRLANVRRAFLIAPDKLGAIENLHVALVDDVMTTGTTLNAAAQELKNAGARKVSNFVFARTPKSRTPPH